MKPTDLESTKTKNIIDMVIGFSAMARVFSAGSVQSISLGLYSTLERLQSLTKRSEFDQLHHEFCLWFIQNIQTAERERNGTIQPSGPASYGQAAKVLDVALKVFIYYCQLPDQETAARILPWIHAAVDTKMMRHLRRISDSEKGVRTTTIEGVDERIYFTLQQLVRRDIELNFQSSILPVQWDDIMWRKLDKRQKPTKGISQIAVSRDSRS